LLSACDQGAYGRGIQIESGGQFLVSEAARPQNQQFRLPIPQARQNLPNLLSLLGRRVGFFRGRQTLRIAGERLVMPPAPPAAEIVQRHTDGGAVKPPTGARAMCPRSPPKLPERFRGQIFGARVIAHHPRYDSRDTLVVGMEERFEVE